MAVLGSDSLHLPAAPLRRFLGGLINAVLIGAVMLVVSVVMDAHPAVSLGVGVALLCLVVISQALTGAGPGGALAGVRLRRIAQYDAAPGRIAFLRACVVAVAAVATCGLGPVIMVARVGGRTWRQTWFDRVIGTTVVVRGGPLDYALSVGDLVVPVTECVVLGRAPVLAQGQRRARPVTVLKDEPSVSKTHALLEPTSQGLLVTDLGSTNGTHIEQADGVHRLRPGTAQTVERGRKVYFGEAMCLIR